mgnify:FL=1|tara:strand:- start:5171 stop:5440 length:270 start_codon:yes stop_codon:yes gene_type:complete
MSNSVEYEIAMNAHREALALKTYTHAEVMDLVDEKTKSQKLMYEEEIEEIAYAVKIWPSELQQLQWSQGGLKNAIIERIKSGVGRDEYF